MRKTSNIVTLSFFILASSSVSAGLIWEFKSRLVLLLQHLTDFQIGRINKIIV